MSPVTRRRAPSPCRRTDVSISFFALSPPAAGRHRDREEDAVRRPISTAEHLDLMIPTMIGKAPGSGCGASMFLIAAPVTMFTARRTRACRSLQDPRNLAELTAYLLHDWPPHGDRLHRQDENRNGISPRGERPASPTRRRARSGRCQPSSLAPREPVEEDSAGEARDPIAYPSSPPSWCSDGVERIGHGPNGLVQLTLLRCHRVVGPGRKRRGRRSPGHRECAITAMPM